MISIIVNGEQLDLLANTSIEFEFINPAFSSAGQDGSFGYPFTLPGTSKNHRITGHAYNLQKRDVLAISIPAKIFVYGLPIADGILKLTFPVSREQIKVFVVVNTFADLVKDQSLRSVNYGAVDTMAISGAAYKTYMNDRIAPGSDRVAFYTSLAYLTQNPYESGVGFNGFYKDIVPHPYIHIIYRNIVEHFGYLFQDSFFTVNDLKHLTLYHHRHVTFDPDTDSFLLDISKLVPDVDVADFIKALDSLFNTKIYVDNQRRNVKLITLESLLDAPVREWTDKADGDYSIEPYDPEGYKMEFDWSNIDNIHKDLYQAGFLYLMKRNLHYGWLNDLTVSDYDELLDPETETAPIAGTTYRTAWVEDAKVFYYYKNFKWQRLQYTFIEGDGDPFALATPEENGVYFDNDTQQWWMYIRFNNYDPTPVWKQFSFRKIEEFYTEPRAKSTITAKAHSVELFYGNFDGYDWITLPCSKIQAFGNGPDGGNQEEVADDESIRLLIYRGLDETAYPGISYPFATPDEFDTRGAVVGTHSLRWDGPRGLYEKFWKRWLDFLGSTRKVKRKLRLTAADIFNLDLTQQVRIENVNYLIGKINVAISVGGISPARCELYTVGSGTESVMATTSGSAPAGGIGVMAVESTNIVG